MRIVFDFEEEERDEIPVIADLHPYALPVKAMPGYRGGRVTVEFLLSEGPTLAIEGTDTQVRMALRTALEMLESLEVYHRPRYEAFAQNAVKCEVCGAYYDRRASEIEHNNGEGQFCLGDGTVRLTENGCWQFLNGDEWERIALDAARKGDCLRREPGDGEEATTWEALADAEERFESHGPDPGDTDWVVHARRVDKSAGAS